MKNKPSPLILALVLFASAGMAHAVLQCYEPFNYTLGTTPTFVSGTPTQTTGGGFASGYNGGAKTTVAGLTYSGLLTAHNAVNVNANWIGENLSAPISTGTVYVSFLMNKSINPSAVLMGLEMNTGGNGMFVGVTAAGDGNQGKLGVNRQAGYNNGAEVRWVSPANNITYGNTHFVVVKLVRNGANWDGSIWLNPTAGTDTEPATTGTFTMPGFTITACTMVNPGGGTFHFDELRIGSTWSDAVSYVPPAPSVPTDLAATPGNNSVALSWTASTGSPVTYNVKRATSEFGTYSTIGTTTAPTVTYNDSILGGPTYWYKVSAVNGGGQSADSAAVSATPIFAPPAAPTGLAASPGDNTVGLTWAATAFATSYNVLRGTVSGTHTVTNTTASTSYTDATAVNGTTYFYVVQAVNAAGDSANSSEVSATPFAFLGVYEPFNYTAGSFVNNTVATGVGLTGNWTCGANGTTVAGLTYPSLPVANNALSSSGSRQYANLASPLSSGTKYISFLYRNSANSGANMNGVFFRNNNSTCLWFGFGLAPVTGTDGKIGLGSMTTAGTAAVGTTSRLVLNQLVYGTAYFVVLKIDFNTSGANDTITVYHNPVANAATPGVAAAGTLSTYDVGTISGIGLNVQGGATFTVDEIRTGNTYGSVVGFNPPPEQFATTLALTATAGKQVSWSAVSTNSYQPQKSADNSTWSDLGSLLIGSAVTSVYDTAPANYYRVLELTTGADGPNAVANPSFEIPADNFVGATNWNGPASTATVQQYVTNQYGAFSPTDGSKMLFMEGQGGSGSVVDTDFVPITGGVTNKVRFDAVNPLKSGGGNPQYRIELFDSGNNVVGSSGFQSFDFVGSSWLTISNNLFAPANAVKMKISFLLAVGAGVGDHRISLMDNVSATSPTPGPTNILSPTVQSSAIFTATVQTNGVTAPFASGTVRFLTNSVGFSTNGVSSGSATSAVASNPGNHPSVTAIYSGDSSFLGSTNTILWGNNPPVANANVSTVNQGQSVAVTNVPGKIQLATDADGDPLTFAVLVAPTSGAATPTAGGLIYTNTANVANVTDTFTYTASDSYGGSATNTITVHVLSVQGYSLIAQSNTVTHAYLTYLGIPGQAYVAERTTTLTPPVVWTPLATNSAQGVSDPLPGRLSFTNAFDGPVNFFRSRPAE